MPHTPRAPTHITAHSYTAVKKILRLGGKKGCPTVKVQKNEKSIEIFT